MSSKFTTGFNSGDTLLDTELDALGDWDSYTPTLTGWTQGNGTLTGAYWQVKKSVFFYLVFTFGTTSSASGEPTFTVPVNMETSAAHQEAISRQVEARAHDATGSSLYLGPCYYVSTSTIRPTVLKVSGSHVPATGYNPGTDPPFTWASGDKIIIAGRYRAA